MMTLMPPFERCLSQREVLGRPLALNILPEFTPIHPEVILLLIVFVDISSISISINIITNDDDDDNNNNKTKTKTK
jgi:hypothetical protein